MPPANIHWDDPQVHDGETGMSPISTRVVPSSGRRPSHDDDAPVMVNSRYKSNGNGNSNNDVVRRVILKSKVDTPSPFETTLCAGLPSDDSSSPSRTRQRWQTIATHKRRSRRYKYSSPNGRLVFSFRAISAMIWLFALLTMLYCGRWTQTKDTSLILENQGPTELVGGKKYGLSFFPSNMTTASYLDFRYNRRLRVENNPKGRKDEATNSEQIIHIIHTRYE